jgi:hypothetical protein
MLNVSDSARCNEQLQLQPLLAMRGEGHAGGDRDLSCEPDIHGDPDTFQILSQRRLL